MVTVCLSEGYIRVSDIRGCSDSCPLIVGHGDCLYLAPPLLHHRFSDVQIADCLWQDMAIASIYHITVTVRRCEVSHCSSLVL